MVEGGLQCGGMAYDVMDGERECDGFGLGQVPMLLPAISRSIWFVSGAFLVHALLVLLDLCGVHVLAPLCGCVQPVRYHLLGVLWKYPSYRCPPLPPFL